jgi:hypothetical protein
MAKFVVVYLVVIDRMKVHAKAPKVKRTRETTIGRSGNHELEGPDLQPHQLIQTATLSQEICWERQIHTPYSGAWHTAGMRIGWE